MRRALELADVVECHDAKALRDADLSFIRSRSARDSSISMVPALPRRG
jgi:hypothetical protein